MPISTAVDASAAARVVGIQTQFKDLRQGGADYLPQRVAIVGQGASNAVYPSTKQRIATAFEAGERYGFGSPIHLAAEQLLPVNGDGVGTVPVTVYPVQAGGSAVAASGSVTVSGTATKTAAYRVNVSGVGSLQFVATTGDSAATIAAAAEAAIDAILSMPVTATAASAVVTLKAKWAGASGNGLAITVEGPTDGGVTFAISQPTGGLINPNIQPALDQFGTEWETMVLNTFNVADTDILDAFETFGEARYGALVRKPLVVFTGQTSANIDTALAVPEARGSDRVNAQLVAPGSPELPLVVAARQLARIVVTANNKPASDYGGQRATGLEAGPAGVQWTYPQRDRAVKAGSSTVEVVDGIVRIGDVVTMFHPQGDPVPAYRYVADIVKIQNIIYNLDQIFTAPGWAGSPLIPDDQPTVNRDAKKPRNAVAAVAAMLDNLGLNAIISDPEYAKANTIAQISEQNPKRLDIATTVKLSGTVSIISVDLSFGFYFGTAQPVG